jgi:hypothetical protein
MGNAINQDAAYLWRWLFKDGGWWTLRSIELHWSPALGHDDVEHAMRALVNGRFLTKRELPHKSAEYAFTTDCLELPGAAPVRQPGATV